MKDKFINIFLVSAIIFAHTGVNAAPSVAKMRSHLSRESMSTVATTELVINRDAPLLSQTELSAQLVEHSGQPIPVAVQFKKPADFETQSIVLEPNEQPRFADDVVRNWTEKISEGFEGSSIFQNAPCQIYDKSNDGNDRRWGVDSFRAQVGSKSIWPARDGNNKVSPATSNYPANMDTWIECGPYDLSQVENAYATYWQWLNIPDNGDDYVFFGVSANGTDYQGFATSGVDNCRQQKIWYSTFTGDSSVWIAWLFHSDADTTTGPGVWLDDLHNWHYNEPTKDCDALDPGKKGLNVSPYFGFQDQDLPLFDDPLHLTLVKETGTHWTRLEFIAKELGSVNVRDYDSLVDSLCSEDIAVLGLVDYQTMARQDWATDIEGYTKAFTETLQVLVRHYRNRIDNWEIWNEEDHPIAGRIEPGNYAKLLKASYETIKAIDPSAKVIYGGSYGIQDDSRQYLLQVLQGWETGKSYFDYLGLHPYFFKPAGIFQNYILDPTRYLHYESPSVISKFLKQISDQGISQKKVWATEIGWNSAVGDPNVGNLTDQVVTLNQQANYLSKSFDILLNEVEQYNSPGTRAVEKVFWFSFIDANVEVPVSSNSQPHFWRQNTFAQDNLNSPTVIRPAFFGLYDTSRKRKNAFCNFQKYPFRFNCQLVYLPFFIR